MVISLVAVAAEFLVVDQFILLRRGELVAGEAVPLGREAILAL
jgi:hypothetical protein